jgi:hypothetical protein
VKYREWEGTPEEVDQFLRLRAGGQAEDDVAPVVSATSPWYSYIESDTSSPDKRRRSVEYVEGVTDEGDLYPKVGGGVRRYLTTRLNGPLEGKVGNVSYLLPRSGAAYPRLPVKAIAGRKFAQKVDSKKTGAAFEAVKFQVIMHIVDDDSLAEAIELTKLAAKMALAGDW